MIIQKKLIITVFITLISSSLLLGKSPVNYTKDATNYIVIAKVNFVKVTIKKGKQTSTPGNTCLRFLSWYVANKSRLGDQRFFNSIADGDTITPVSINLEYVKKYKGELKKTGFVSEGFLKTIQLRYDSADTYLKANLSPDKPLIDIETDPVIQLGEPDVLTKYIKNLQVSSIKYNSGYCYVTLKVSKYLNYMFVLTEQKKKWLIDAIVRRPN